MGLLKTAAKVAVASSVHGRIQRRQQQRWAAEDAAQVGPPPTRAAPSAAATPAVDMATKLNQLQQLGELKTAGVLTDAEFESQKAAIMAQ